MKYKLTLICLISTFAIVGCNNTGGVSQTASSPNATSINNTSSLRQITDEEQNNNSELHVNNFSGIEFKNCNLTLDGATKITNSFSLSNDFQQQKIISTEASTGIGLSQNFKSFSLNCIDNKNNKYVTALTKDDFFAVQATDTMTNYPGTNWSSRISLGGVVDQTGSLDLSYAARHLGTAAWHSTLADKKLYKVIESTDINVPVSQLTENTKYVIYNSRLARYFVLQMEKNGNLTASYYNSNFDPNSKTTYWTSETTDKGIVTTFESNGKFRVRDKDKGIVWDNGKHYNDWIDSGRVFIFQSDGNLVVYDTVNKGRALWAACSDNQRKMDCNWPMEPTTRVPHIKAETTGASITIPNDTILNIGDEYKIHNPVLNQTYQLLMDYDGDLKVLVNGKLYWHSNTAANNYNLDNINGGGKAKFSSNGKIVVYALKDGSVLWNNAVNTANAGFLFQNDGNLIVYAGNTAQGGLWDSCGDNQAGKCHEFWDAPVVNRNAYNVVINANQNLQIPNNQLLSPGDAIKMTVPGAEMMLVMQYNGDFAAYRNGIEYWKSRTTNGSEKGTHTWFKSTGEFIVSDSKGRQRWSSGTAGRGTGFLYPGTGNLKVLGTSWAMCNDNQAISPGCTWSY